MAGMIVALPFGGGLVSLSFIYICSTTIKELTRKWIAYRICPELRFCQDTPGLALLRVIPAPGFGEKDRVRICQNLG